MCLFQKVVKVVRTSQGDCILPLGRKGTADFAIRSRASGLIQQLLPHRIVQLLIMSACEYPAVELVHWVKQN